MSPDKENSIEKDSKSYFNFFWRHICFYLLLLAFFFIVFTKRPMERVDSVVYTAVGSHLYYNHNWLPTEDGGSTKDANEGYAFLHVLTTSVMGNAPLSRAMAMSLVAFMLGSFFYIQCLRHFFSLREAQLILLLLLPLLDVIVIPKTDSIAWCFCSAIMWIFIKKNFRVSFIFGLMLGIGYLCRNHVLVIFLPLPILMGTLSTWKKDWRALSWDLCRCAAGFVIPLILFEILVALWVQSPATTGNFYIDFYEENAPAQDKLWFFWRYCKSIIITRLDVYLGIITVALLTIVFCPATKFAWRFACFFLCSFVATFFSYALLVYSRGEPAIGGFPLRYLAYYNSMIVPLLYWFASVVARRINRRNLIPLPRIITASKAYSVLLTIALVVWFSLPLDIHLVRKIYMTMRDTVQFARHPDPIAIEFYPNELALSHDLCQMPHPKNSLCIFFGNVKTELYKALYPIPSYDANTLITYRYDTSDQLREDVKKFFDDYNLQEFSRIVLAVDDTYLDGVEDETDKAMFDKFLSDERLTKAFDRKEYDCKDCVFFVFTAKKQP